MTVLKFGEEPEENTQSLKTGQYTIKFSNGPTQIWKTDLSGREEWICTTNDYTMAMEIVEGLILVEHKRFYHPDSKPDIKMEGDTSPDKRGTPKFLQRKS